MNLVFASGFLVPQRILGVDYFRGLKVHIGDRHATLFPEVPPVGGSANRAAKLAAAIQNKFPTGEIHIIAHSMGGLDSRVLIAGNLEGLSNPGRIKSLTTISTPHRGTPAADLVVGPRPEDDRREAYDAITHAIRLLGIDIGSLKDLTTQGAAAIPDPRQTHPHIRYRSYCAMGRPGRSGLLGFLGIGVKKTSAVFVPTHKYIEVVTGQDNDGVVPVESAKYGEVQQPFWQCDHADAIGHNLDDPLNLGQSPFDHLAAYDAIISQL
jgi:triacylglycerol lipase